MCGSDFKRRDLLHKLGNIMCLIKNDNWVGKIYFHRVSNILINQIIIRHENNVSLLRPFFITIIRAKLMLFCQCMEFLDIRHFPCHLPCFRAIIEILARRLSYSFACSIQHRPPIPVYFLINAQMVSRCYQHWPRFIHSFLQLCLYLCQLWVSSRGVNNFGQMISLKRCAFMGQPC